MTLSACKHNFIDLLADKDNRVIALSGKWGTGKSHLWKEVQALSPDDIVKEAVYVSLFGLSSVAELKMKIAQGALSKLEAGSSLAESIRNACSGVKKVLKGLHSSFSALDELVLIAAPMMIKGRFIVIDDIERKHKKLSIDEILGFIDDCVQNLDCRILLILNSDQLADKKLWELFREKVIDQELRLSTSPAEAFDIAERLSPSTYSAYIKPAVEACQINNIRIIRKIIRVINLLLANRGQVFSDVLNRVIPSTTLLSAIHYKGIEGGPDFNFVLHFESSFAAIQVRDHKAQDQEDTAETKAWERWRLLMDRLGIRGTDEFEQLVADYLSSGLLNRTSVAKVIDSYTAEGRMLSARARAQDFLEHCIWNPELTEVELLIELRALLPDVDMLDMFTATSLHERALEFADGESLAKEIISTWIDGFRQRHLPNQEFQLDSDFNWLNRPLHPEIKRELDAIQAQQSCSMTILGVCRKVREEQGWGPREESFMKSVTSKDYEQAIKAASGGDLKLLLLQSRSFLKSRRMYESHFGGAVQSFVDGCQAIIQSNENPRLCKLLSDLISKSGVNRESAVLNRTGNRGGCLVKVKQVPQPVLQVVDSNALQLRLAGCHRSIPIGAGG